MRRWEKDGCPCGSRQRKGDGDSREAAAAVVRMTHVKRGREMPATHNAGDSSRTPQALSRLFCSWRFVGFLPRDDKTTVVRLGAAWCGSSRLASSRSRVALKLLKWKRVCHSHYVRLSLGGAATFSLFFARSRSLFFLVLSCLPAFLHLLSSSVLFISIAHFAHFSDLRVRGYG